MFCRECGASIEDDSKFCKECGKPQTGHPARAAAIREPASPPEPEAPDAPAPKKAIPSWVIATCAIVFLIFVIAILAGTPKGSAPDASQADLNAAANAAIADVAAATSSGSADAPTPAAAPENWSYSTDTDKVRGGTTYFATTTSTNTVHQDAPYDSDTSMTLSIRRAPGSGLNIILHISSGQMMCPSYEGCSGTVRFDSGPAERIRFAGPDDENSQTIFVEGERSFLAKLKRSKRLIVEKTLYEAGAPQFEFDVHGLKWDH